MPFNNQTFKFGKQVSIFEDDEKDAQGRVVHETCKQPHPVDCDAKHWKLSIIDYEKLEYKWIHDAVSIQCGILYILFAFINTYTLPFLLQEH